MTSTIREALKPCPFCGGAVEVRQSHVRGESDWIQHLPKDGGACCALEFSGFSIEDDLVKAWNTRADQPSTESVVDLEAIARGINEMCNKKWNAYMLGKEESFELARAVLDAAGVPYVD